MSSAALWRMVVLNSGHSLCMVSADSAVVCIVALLYKMCAVGQAFLLLIPDGQMNDILHADVHGHPIIPN